MTELDLEWRIRVAEAVDVPAMVRLWNRSCRFDPLTPALLREKIWEDIAGALVVEAGKRIVGFVVYVARERSGFLKMLAVDHEYRRRGIAERLLRNAEKVLRTRGCTRIRLGESAPNYLVPGLDERYEEALAFFEALGFKRFGLIHDMVAPLEGLESRQDPDAEAELAAAGIELTRATLKHRNEVIRFLSEWWPVWVAEVSRAFAADPISLHLALKDDRVVGFAAHDAVDEQSQLSGPRVVDELDQHHLTAVRTAPVGLDVGQLAIDVAIAQHQVVGPRELQV